MGYNYGINIRLLTVKGVVVMENKRYKLEDLHEGMHVKKSELSDIFDTLFILTDSEQVPGTDIDVEGTLVYFGPDGTKESIYWFNQTEKGICPIIFSEDEADENSVYFE